MNPCENIRDSIGSWLDGELSPSQSEAVQAHVASCRACAETRRQLDKIHRTLKSSLDAEAARIDFLPFWREVQSRINRKRSPIEHMMDWGRDILSAPRVAWAIPAVIIVLIGVLSLDAYLPGWKFGAARNSFAAVDSIDAHGSSVALLRENETKTTVIWLYQDEEGENDAAADESAKSGPTF